MSADSDGDSGFGTAQQQHGTADTADYTTMSEHSTPTPTIDSWDELKICGGGRVMAGMAVETMRRGGRRPSSVTDVVELSERRIALIVVRLVLLLLSTDPPLERQFEVLKTTN